MFSRVSDSGGVKTFTFIGALLLSPVSLAFVLPIASTNLPAPAKINVTAVEDVSSGDTIKPITVDYPDEESIFPPDMAPPTFLRDGAEEATSWQIDLVFADGSPNVRITTSGEHFQIGEIDERCVAPSNQRPILSTQLAATRTWVPGDATWASLKKHAKEVPATITFTGLREKLPVSRGKVSLQISKDPVGAPIFYRDVPLMPTEGDKNAIKPIDPKAMPLIAWRLRYVGEPSFADRPAHLRQLSFFFE